jgi:hypothetical protein
MATANDRRDTSVQPPGNLYPWSDWQNGQWWTIEAGVDFDASLALKTMRDQLHVRARASKVKVRTHMDKVSKITFMFQKKDETDEAFEQRYAETSH